MVGVELGWEDVRVLNSGVEPWLGFWKFSR